MGEIIIDGVVAELVLPEGTTFASAYSVARDQVLEQGRIVVDVSIGDDVVTWQDGSAIWDQPVRSGPSLVLMTDYPVRISGPLVERLAETLETVSEQHREMAEALRQQEETAAERTAHLLGVWNELYHVLDQVCILHGIDLKKEPWTKVADSLRARFDKLDATLRELKEALEARDMVLSADLLEFELAPLAKEFATPCREFRQELERQFPIPSGNA